MKNIALVFAILFLIYYPLACQVVWDQNHLKQTASQYSHSSMGMFIEMLSIPNDSHYPEMLMENIQWFEKAFSDRGFTVKRLETPSVSSLLIERKVKNPGKTILFYMHGDGQPVQPELWHQENPWKPVLKEKDASGEWKIIPWDRLDQKFDPDWRIFARAASDDKGPIAMFLAAIDALDASGYEPAFDIKLFLDFEEEIGSPHLPKAVSDYKKLLEADMIIIFDGPNHASNHPTLVFGARGIATVTLTSYGPVTAQHSGHFGNYAPNPAFTMARLLATLKDQNGRVLIPGYYDGVNLTDAEREILRNVPDDEQAIRAGLGIARAEMVGGSYQESIQYPSLNIRGMQSGWVGSQVRTIVPATCVAEIDIRLVPESDPDRLIKLVKDYIEMQGYFLTDKDPTMAELMQHEQIIKFESTVSYQAFRTPMDAPPGIWLHKAMLRAYGTEPVRIRIGGGSLPIAPFVNILEIPAVIVPTVNPDNNQHSPNENLRLGNYRDGIRSILAILTQDFD